MSSIKIGTKLVWENEQCEVVGYDFSEPHPTITKAEVSAPWYLLQAEGKLASEAFKVPKKKLENYYGNRTKS